MSFILTLVLVYHVFTNNWLKLLFQHSAAQTIHSSLPPIGAVGTKIPPAEEAPGPKRSKFLFVNKLISLLFLRSTVSWENNNKAQWLANSLASNMNSKYHRDFDCLAFQLRLKIQEFQFDTETEFNKILFNGKLFLVNYSMTCCWKVKGILILFLNKNENKLCEMWEACLYSCTFLESHLS